MVDAQNELKSSNEKHNLLIEKYKQDLYNMKNQYAEERSNLEQQLKDVKENYRRELENVRQCRTLFANTGP